MNLHIYKKYCAHQKKHFQNVVKRLRILKNTYKKYTTL